MAASVLLLPAGLAAERAALGTASGQRLGAASARSARLVLSPFRRAARSPSSDQRAHGHSVAVQVTDARRPWLAQVGRSALVVLFRRSAAEAERREPLGLGQKVNAGERSGFHRLSFVARAND